MWTTEYEGLSVLVTGHTGFKGSWLCLWLRQLGARVCGLALEPETQPNLFEAAQVGDLLEGNFIGDVRDEAFVERVVEESNPDLIFHLAAQPLVRRSYAQPSETFTTNFNGTLNVLEAVRLRGKPCVAVMVTTDKVYRNVEQVWGYRESDPLGGDDPYSASKAACETVIHSYQRSFFQKEGKIRVAAARGGNVVGGGDWSVDRIVPDLVRSLESNSSLEVRSPRSVRPWQHVLDLLSGYLQLAVKLRDASGSEWTGAWNFGPHVGQDVNVGELVEQFIGVWGSGSWSDVSHGEHLHEANILRLAIDKSVARLGWSPTWGVAETVEKTALWYRDYLKGQGARELVERDINSFLAQVVAAR